MPLNAVHIHDYYLTVTSHDALSLGNSSTVGKGARRPEPCVRRDRRQQLSLHHLNSVEFRWDLITLFLRLCALY